MFNIIQEVKRCAQIGATKSARRRQAKGSNFYSRIKDRSVQGIAFRIDNNRVSPSVSHPRQMLKGSGGAPVSICFEETKADE